MNDTNSSFAKTYVGMRFLTLVRLPLFTLHRKCKTIRRLSPPVFWKCVLILSPSTLYDSDGEMSEYLIVPLAKRQNQLATSKSLPTRTVAPSPRKAKAGIVAHLRIDLEDGFAAVVTAICNRVHVCVRLSAVRRFNCAYGRASARAGRFAHDARATLRRDPSTAGRARCWKRRWCKSDRVHHSLSPRDPRDRRARQLSLGPAPQTRHDRLGNFRALAIAEGAQTSSLWGDQASSLILTLAGKMPVPCRSTLPNEAQGLS